MKLLRFRYILPVSLLIIFDLILIAYAKIMWDDEVESTVWHGPKNAPYTDNMATWSTDGNWDDSYTCPVIPKKKKPGDGDAGDSDSGDGDSDSGDGGTTTPPNDSTSLGENF